MIAKCLDCGCSTFLVPETDMHRVRWDLCEDCYKKRVAENRVKIEAELERMRIEQKEK